MELPKAFNIIDPSLLIAKLKAYDFDCVSLKLTEIYITNRKQRYKLGNYFSLWRTITSGIPQVSIPLIINSFYF